MLDLLMQTVILTLIHFVSRFSSCLPIHAVLLSGHSAADKSIKHLGQFGSICFCWSLLISTNINKIAVSELKKSIRTNQKFRSTKNSINILRMDLNWRSISCTSNQTTNGSPFLSLCGCAFVRLRSDIVLSMFISAAPKKTRLWFHLLAPS